MNFTNLGDNPQNIMAAGFEDAFKDHIRNATPLVYFGASAGSEFLTHAVTKMYVAFEFAAGYSVLTAVANPGTVTFYNAANAAQFTSGEGVGLWDGAFKYTSTLFEIKNIYFSRIVMAQYNYMKFIGFRVTLY